MLRIIKKANGKHGNKLEFIQWSNKKVEHVIVSDRSAQIERTYVVGRVQELDNFDEVEIVSVDQVIEAWTKGTVWF